MYFPTVSFLSLSLFFSILCHCLSLSLRSLTCSTFNSCTFIFHVFLVFVMLFGFIWMLVQWFCNVGFVFALILYFGTRLPCTWVGLWNKLFSSPVLPTFSSFVSRTQIPQCFQQKCDCTSRWQYTHFILFFLANNVRVTLDFDDLHPACCNIIAFGNKTKAPLSSEVNHLRVFTG